ncbi:MAG: MBL fold metallo-hydrolase [Bacteroidetes bacterium]|nr:MAG: MBL fold metallo-hydrolase [Bacteroidota bacterium]
MKSIFSLIFSAFSLGLIAQRNFDGVQIEPVQVSENVYVLFGSGGNIALVAGENQNYIIDDQFAPLSDKINFTIQQINPNPVAYVLNTHWHGDHTGGNANFAMNGATIIAHDRVYDRLKTGQQSARRNIPPAAIEALPTISFSDQLKLRYREDAEIHAFHVNDAHTDGDSFYYFVTENVIHLGDNFFNERYPYVDISSGGDIDGMISNLYMAASMIDDETVIIPGHGKVANKRQLIDYANLLDLFRELVVELREEGKSIEEIIEIRPLAEWDDTYGSGFIAPEAFLRAIFETAD